MKISIGKQLSIGFGVLILLFVIVGLMNINRLLVIESGIKEITEVGQVGQDAAEEMEINLIGTGFGLLGYLHDHDPKHLARIEDDQMDFEKFHAQFDQLADTQEHKALSQKVIKSYTKLKKTADVLVSLKIEINSNIAVFQELLLMIDSVLDDKMQASLNPDDPQVQRRLRAAMEIEINANGIAKGLGNYLRTPKPEFVQQIEKDVGDLKNALSVYEGSTLSANEKGWAREIREIFEKMALHVREIVKLETDIRKGLASFVNMRREIDGILDDEIQIMTKKELLSEKKAAFSAIDTASTATFISLVVGLVVAILLGMYISRGVLRQVGGEPALIAGVTAQVARGDLDIEISGEAETSTGILASVITMTETLKDVAEQANTIAGGDYTADVSPRSDKDELGIALQTMTKMLREASQTTTAQDWLKTGLNRLDDVMRGDLGVAEIGEQVVSELASHLDAQLAAVYLVEEIENETVLTLASSYAYTKRKNLSNRFALGEGLVGQAAKEKKQILVSNVPEDYIKVTSGLGEASPAFISVTPLVYENRVSGVIEVGTLDHATDLQLEYLSQAVSAVAINIEAARGRDELAHELDRSQSLSEELQDQQEELKVTNEELEEQTQRLKQSEEELKAINEELEEKSEVLGRQKRKVEISRRDIEQKAKELAEASKYKSEFLANMSHELRTPLNSLLILSQTLADNDDGNLSEDQVRAASIIYSSGNDLLSLINEILDLAKIEAGHMEVNAGKVLVADLVESIRRSFVHMTKDKDLDFEVTADEAAPQELFSDRKRIEQIVKNLVSNAIKFTDQGSVTVRIGRVSENVDLSRIGLDRADAVAISVEDTGVGIPLDKQREIFEAFHQVDGTATRMHAGTGLGLSISRELAGVLGGEIQLASAPGQGSTFIVYLPVESVLGKADGEQKSSIGEAEQDSKVASIGKNDPAVGMIPDDRDGIAEGDRVILVVEDDPRFASILLKQCHDKGFRCLATPTGEDGLELAKRFLPQAMILDLKLPGIDGWAVLDALKDDPKTRHIPVHIMSVEEPSLDARRRGAIGHLTKPARKEELEEAFGKLEEMLSKGMKKLLVVEDKENLRESIIELIGNGDVEAQSVETGKNAIATLQAAKYDCVIMDLDLPDMTGFDLLEKLEADESVTMPPVVVYTGRDLTRDQEARLHEYTESIIVKGVQSEERLLDEASLFLHRLVDAMPASKRRMIADLHDRDRMFENKQVLVVDDDMRNVFALSEVLTKKGFKVHKAENGKKALEILNRTPGVDLVLMDVMMPEMDGYETTRRIRAQKTLKSLPIIALTAKAMKQDRDKCIVAGASDYLPKPVDVNRLLSMMRVWMYR